MFHGPPRPVSSDSKPQNPVVGNSSNAETLPIPSGNEPKHRSRSGWFQSSKDFLVGKSMLSAAESGNTQQLVSILEDMQNINHQSFDWEETALHKAIKNGHKHIVQLLLAKGASIEVTNCYNETPLHYAASKGCTSIVELLLSKGASVEARGDDGDTPLHDAAKRGHTGIVKLLLSNGASITAVNKAKKTPLDLAKRKRHTDVINLFQNDAYQF